MDRAPTAGTSVQVEVSNPADAALVGTGMFGQVPAKKWWHLLPLYIEILSPLACLAQHVIVVQSAGLDCQKKVGSSPCT